MYSFMKCLNGLLLCWVISICSIELFKFLTCFNFPLFINVLFRFDHVPLATPNGDILIQDLSFEVSFKMFI